MFLRVVGVQPGNHTFEIPVPSRPLRRLPLASATVVCVSYFEHPLLSVSSRRGRGGSAIFIFKLNRFLHINP